MNHPSEWKRIYHPRSGNYVYKHKGTGVITDSLMKIGKVMKKPLTVIAKKTEKKGTEKTGEKIAKKAGDKIGQAKAKRSGKAKPTNKNNSSCFKRCYDKIKSGNCKFII